MLNYLLIESKNNIELNKSMILDMMHDVMHMIEVKSKNQTLIIVFEMPVEVSFNEIILNLAQDTLVDYRLYESYPFKQIEELYQHAAYIESLLQHIPFNQFTYLNNIILVKYALTIIKKENYHFFLRDYWKNEDMKKTIKVYLESNQNMSEASKSLYIHRNTLIQRIDKFAMVTGFDIRKFVDGYLIYYLLTH
ncbi:MAG: helix-turn-helix domain-containing protein [Acholeplasmataceae bacterium]